MTTVPPSLTDARDLLLIIAEYTLRANKKLSRHLGNAHRRPKNAEYKAQIVDLQQKLVALGDKTNELLLSTVELNGPNDTYGLYSRVDAVRERLNELQKLVDGLVKP